MGFILKNNKERVLNLGTKEGCMLCLKPSEEKFVPDSVAQLFYSEIEHYSNNELITIVDKVKEVIQTNQFVATETTVADTPAKKRTRKSNKTE